MLHGSNTNAERYSRTLTPKDMKLVYALNFVLFWSINEGVYLGVKACEVFLSLVRVRVYYVDFFVFVLRH